MIKVIKKLVSVFAVATNNAVTLNSTGSVLMYGFQDFTLDPTFDPQTMTQVQIAEDAMVPNNVPLKYCKIVPSTGSSTAQIVEMTQAEKDAVDNVIPTDNIQRKIFNAETVVNAGGSDATTGWTSVISGSFVTKPFSAGDYQMLLSFELSQTAVGTWSSSGPDRFAQARLLVNGNEFSTFVNPFQLYNRCTLTAGNTLTEGQQLTIDLQIRRFGTAGSARARKIRLEIAPVTQTPTNL